VRVADVFKAPILANAASVIFCHNHPSGAPRSAQVEC
jgi:DNA repair protein RadC